MAPSVVLWVRLCRGSKITLICRQLFAGHTVGSRPMKGKGKIHQMKVTCPVELKIEEHERRSYIAHSCKRTELSWCSEHK